jgi:hypothetical protein
VSPLAGHRPSPRVARRGPAAVPGGAVRNRALRRGIVRWGVEKNTFKVPDSGETVGSYAQYFGGGSIRGKFDLSPTEGSGDLSSTPTSFTSESWTGTVTVTKGSGALAKAAGKKGVLKCTSGDSVHLTCTEKIKLTQL